MAVLNVILAVSLVALFLVSLIVDRVLLSERVRKLEMKLRHESYKKED
ncbi:hypothetical protein [Limosilactobacillus fermentum]|nr:hypothetical protein [Limosilactobacillus fermentum]